MSGTPEEPKSGETKEKSTSDRWAADIGGMTITKGDGSDNTLIMPTVDFHYKGNKTTIFLYSLTYVQS